MAINDINQKTDIKAAYQQHKKGRSISGFSFSFKQKKAAIKSMAQKKDEPIVLTDAQRYLFAGKLSELPEMGKLSLGTESYEQFAVRIADMLQDPEKVKEFTPLLRKVGFQ